jgi:hypothetical protein
MAYEPCHFGAGYVVRDYSGLTRTRAAADRDGCADIHVIGSTRSQRDG